MATLRQQDGLDVWTITSSDGGTQASFVPALGGIGSSIILPGPDGPRELLYQHPFFWDPEDDRTRGGWPFLFPVCGRLSVDGELEAYSWNGVTYRLPIHGFGPNAPWTAVDTEDPQEITVQLTDTEDTRTGYPFAFRLQLRYRVSDAELCCHMSVTNRSAGPMPYYAGFHPYFLTPPAGKGKEAVTMDLQPVARGVYNEDLTDVLGETEPPRLPLSIADPVVNEMLCRLTENRETSLRFPDGFVLRMRVDGEEDAALFPYAQFYTMPEEPFFCVEPWMGHPGALNHPEAVHTLAPGKTEQATLRLWSDTTRR